MKNIKDVKKKIHGGLPEKVLQIGEGNFLRAFADWMIDHTNSAGCFNGSVVLCQPIQMGMAEQINAQNGIYTVMMRGVENNQVVERIEEVTSISRCINPYSDYESLVAIAKSPDLKVIISNTTEAGIAYHAGDKLTDKPPVSYPAKMTVLLYERFKKLNGQADKGLLILPVELIERNGDNLKRYVLQYAAEWGLETAFTEWLENANCFANTLVDRIVTGYPRDEIKEIRESLGYEDNILVTCEPFNLWVIEAPQKWANVIPLKGDNVHVIWTSDMTPYRTRKVRILNGAHTVSVLAAYLAGHDIVLSMMKDKVFEQYLRKCIWNEIIPTIPLPKKEMDEFANAVFERFSNPFIKHRLLDISLNSVSKYKARCLPSLLDNINKSHKLPPILPFGLAALIAFYKGTMQDGKYIGTRGDNTYEIRDNADILTFFAKAWQHPEDIVEKVLSNVDFWGQDLTKISGLKKLVDEDLGTIIRDGAATAVKNLVESL
ncbi:MAG TPA: tagaturonate reductase [Firmicutes bacterium]|jgi:tagaturonate reductase|nr:tagaturonate reductase [Bacillota bacterium]